MLVAGQRLLAGERPQPVEVFERGSRFACRGVVGLAGIGCLETSSGVQLRQALGSVVEGLGCGGEVADFVCRLAELIGADDAVGRRDRLACDLRRRVGREPALPVVLRESCGFLRRETVQVIQPGLRIEIELTQPGAAPAALDRNLLGSREVGFPRRILNG